MVDQSSGKLINTNSPDNGDQDILAAIKWIDMLQKAFSLESESSFKNLLGRGEYFNSFISRNFYSPPKLSCFSSKYERLHSLAKSFDSYVTASDQRRRYLVAQSRQLLHLLSSDLKPRIVVKQEKLNLQPLYQKSKKVTNTSISKLTLKSNLSEVDGVGTKLASKLFTLGLLTVDDALNYYPRDYIDYSNLNRITSLKDGETTTILVTVRRSSAFKSPKNPNLSILELYVHDHTGKLKVTKFFAGRRFSNYSYLKAQSNLYPPGSKVAISGLVKFGPYGKNIKDPLIEVLENPKSQIKSKSIGRLLPIYSLTEGLTAERFRAIIQNILPLTNLYSDPLPNPLLQQLCFPVKSEAIASIHFPSDKDTLNLARRRLIFDEFLLFQLTLLRRKRVFKLKDSPNLITCKKGDSLLNKLFDLLPFELTNAQKRVLAEIKADLIRSEPMARLIQGDVGSGKTVIAQAALIEAVEAGWQGALMAPTEVLAEQHFRKLCQLFPQLHINVELLTGSTPISKRKRILDDLTNGAIQILVGTHALIEDPVSFFRLGLVIVDEQHRFGVNQRNRLLDKGLQPHLLTMTATPIPRTLALSLHGDLDVSQIDELPPGRHPIETKLISSGSIENAYKLIREEIEKGQKAYFVLPLVEDSEKLNLRSAVNVHKQLDEKIFKEFNVGLLHGRLSAFEKQSIIQNFVQGKFDILVSTTVIEVGVDVPEATVMVIDHADRFGLSQLHQLRGRVGRGAEKSYCILINESSNPQAKTRLDVLVSSNDGFEISEIDLKLRGPGQILGTKQSGLPDFALASLLDHSDVLELARKVANDIIEIDPDLKHHSLLYELIDQQRNKVLAASNLN